MDQSEVKRELDKMSKDDLTENLSYLIREMADKDQLEFLGIAKEDE